MAWEENRPFLGRRVAGTGHSPADRPGVQVATCELTLLLSLGIERGVLHPTAGDEVR
jgi:hypothetical protein